MNVRFVVLGYTRDITAAKGIDIAIATEVCTPVARLALQLAPNWTKLVNPEDRLYLNAVFVELLEQPAADSLDAISELSTGCLRTNAVGICDHNSLPQLDNIPFCP